MSWIFWLPFHFNTEIKKATSIVAFVLKIIEVVICGENCYFPLVYHLA
jgi:hypothetical protein